MYAIIKQELYCKVLERYKDELSKPVEEATTFITQIETQLSKLLLVNDNTTTPTSYSFNYLSGTYLLKHSYYLITRPLN